MRPRYRKSPFESLLPYLIIIAAGVIVILLFQLYSVITYKPVLSEVYFHVVKGEAQIYPWGSQGWQKGYSGTRILQGDSLRTFSDSRVVLEFYDGTKVRLSEETEIVFDEIKNEEEVNQFLLTLKKGNLWINKSISSAKKTDVLVNMKDTSIKSLGTIFALDKGNKSEDVRVMKGRVSVDVYKFEEDEKTIVDTLEIGVGQEAIFDARAIKEFREYKRPYVLEALSDDFKATSWYKWNIQEDGNPTNFAGGGGSVLEENSATADVQAS